MQISSLSPLANTAAANSGATSSTATGAALRPVAVPVSPPVTKPGADAARVASATTTALSAQAVRRRDPQLNQRIAGAQQTEHFLGELGAELETLRDGLGNRLARGRAAGEAQHTALEQVDARWRQRHAASAGGLDGQLHYTAAGGAQVSFRIAGLDARSLQQGKRETLALSFGTGAPKVLSVRIDPTRDGVRQLADALLPAGIRVVGENGAGDLGLSVSEADWPALRDTVAIRGEGMRFPAGAFHRVRAKAEPEAIDPAAWAIHDEASMRQTLNRVTRALDGVGAAKEQVRAVMADAAAGTVVPEQDGAVAASFSIRFVEMTEKPGFETLSAVLPALNGISRRRVESLLKVGE